MLSAAFVERGFPFRANDIFFLVSSEATLCFRISENFSRVSAEHPCPIFDFDSFAHLICEWSAQ
jgi:hypothetical protein